ncbi:ATP-dependent helicase C-terminal domain-containing protein [Shigella flexneri]
MRRGRCLVRPPIRRSPRRVPLVLELLSPAQRPLQITRDFLSAFWKGAYREVQKR